jgi:hypothetical protein
MYDKAEKRPLGRTRVRLTKRFNQEQKFFLAGEGDTRLAKR